MDTVTVSDSVAIRVPLAEITIGNNRRSLRDIERLAESIGDVGLLNPITITPDKRLIAGWHRLEAVKLLGWEEIDCRIVDLSDLKAELAVIDENLIRNELTVLERGEKLKRRKEIYELMHPETKQHIAGGKVRQDPATEMISFAEDTARRVGVTDRTIRQEVQIASRIEPEVKEAIRTTELADNKSELLRLARMNAKEQSAVVDIIATGKAHNVKDATTKVRRAAKVEQAGHTVLPPEIKIIHGDFRQAGTEVGDNSVDLIFTDPPYGEEYLELWSDLASLAKRVLKPGALLLSYSGQAFLPQVLQRLSEGLDYVWMCGIYYTGGHIQIWKHKIWNQWKPILVFSKGPPSDHDWLLDMFHGEKGDKDNHDWAQGVQEAAYFIEKLTPPAGLVFDPMMGSGTTLVAAKRLGRSGLGIDIEEENCQIARVSVSQ